jgi:hypothetical protein
MLGAELDFTDRMESFNSSASSEQTQFFELGEAFRKARTKKGIILLVKQPQPRPAYLFARCEGDGWETSPAKPQDEGTNMSYEILEKSYPKACEFLRSEIPFAQIDNDSPFSVLFNAINIAARC